MTQSQQPNKHHSYDLLNNITKWFVESFEKHSNCPSQKKISKYITKKYNSKQLILLLKHIIYGNDTTSYLEINYNKINKIEYLTLEILNPLKWLIIQFKPISNYKNKTKKLNYLNCTHYKKFVEGHSTHYLRNFSHFWTCLTISKKQTKNNIPKWWDNSPSFINKTLLSTCHFIQSNSGTGIHIGNGYILTCAHVVECDELEDLNDNNDFENINIGRIKWVMFANGMIYCCICIAIQSCANSRQDIALLKIIPCTCIDILCAIDQNNVKRYLNYDMTLNIGYAMIAKTAPKLYSKLFCIGNPSDIDLETNRKNVSTNLCPAVWHLSFGKLEAKINDIMDEESKCEIDFNDVGGYGHSCWTYWGHSGAPIFNTNGNLVALHSSWNDKTGLRHAIEYKIITKFISKNIKHK